MTADINDILQGILARLDGIDEMLTAERVCDMLGVSRSYLHHLCADGELTYYQRKQGARLYFDRADVLAFMRQGRHASRQHNEISATTLLTTQTNIFKS